MKEKVLLHTAFWWDCPECGTENYHRGISYDLQHEDMELLRQKHNLDDDELFTFDVDWILAPENVTCSKCKNSFESMDDRDIELGDFENE